MADDTIRDETDGAIVARVLANDPNAFGELYDRWFDRVLDLSFRIVLDTNVAAAVAQDTFLAAFRNLGRLEDPNLFGGWLLRIARNRAIDRYRSLQPTQPTPATQPTDATPLTPAEPSPTRPEDTLGTIEDPARVADDSAYAALLWDAADALGARDREVLDLSLRHGLTPDDVAEVLGINHNATNQLVHRVQQRLGTALEARMLWRGGAPMCAALRADLVAADVEVFDGDAVRVADRHAAGCADCTARRKLSVDAVRLFAAIPILAIPALRAKTAYALAAAGVPMQGSHAFDGGAPPPPPKRNGGSHARRWIIAGAVAGIIVILAVIVGASSVGHEPSHVVVVVAKSTTSSSSVATTSSSTSSTTTSTTSTTTTVPVTVAPPPVTTTTQPPVVARLTLKPSTVTQDYATTAAAAPLVTWSTSGLARLDVHDDGKVFDRTSASGSALVCPGKADTTPKGTCTAKPGTYVYTLDGFDSSNNLVVHRTLTLTIKSAGP